ncbi:MAG TPA: S8 family peptidase [Geminicoccaceae bacterium]|nr:S8 family peptidase [Geminicoccaceae bacterium]
MATPVFPLPAKLVEYILLGPAEDQRQLQDSPILGDVWLAYAADPASTQDLLITPHWSATSAELASAVAERLEKARRGQAGIAYLQGIVAARLSFAEVLRVLVPLSAWWRERKIHDKLGTGGDQRYGQRELTDRLRQMFSPETFIRAKTGPSDVYDSFTTLDRYVALAGLILWAGKRTRRARVPAELPVEKVLEKIEPEADEIAEGLLALYAALPVEPPVADDARAADEAGHKSLVFQVSLNRRARPALERSVPAVKGDAARTLFTVDCSKIVWAVLDSGIDGRHPAFMVQNKHTGGFESRVRKTFDFTRVRDILGSGNASMRKERMNELLQGLSLSEAEARKQLKHLAKDAEAKRPTNWDVVEELITLADPPVPRSAHGTHVAGIIGADRNGNGKRSDYAGGMCPDIRLYDFRVLAKSIEDTEFAVIAALQYIRYVNDQHNTIKIHGANLSLSIPHNVRNFACGRTPICNECERLVDNGVVVVAAAGNRGYQNFETKEGIYEGYAAFSITDPGNADGVITVGATHGNWPHTYGVSFFSSRGPTGDGRHKPDLVAPGERIQSTVPNNEWGPESGTSMAAPHVSGAAAMLLARYAEMIGQPRRVKRILCENATDLGRERSFQGHGMLDVLRAFQAI